MFINEALADTDTITIQDIDETPEAPKLADSPWASVTPIVLILFIFYFLVLRPQEKKRKEQEQFVAGVKKGEQIMTNFGLFGTVRKINDSDNTVMLEIADNVEVKILKNSIADITSRNKSDDKVKVDKLDKKKSNNKAKK